MSRTTECLRHQNLQQVRSIDLSFNSIDTVNFKFLLMSSLQSLNLSHNTIGPAISPEDLDFKLTFGLSVDLSYNKIERVDLREKEGTEISKGSHVFRYLLCLFLLLKIFAENFLLNLSGNPLRCDCWATELRAKVAGEDGGSSYSRMFRLTHHPLTCSSNNNNNNNSSTAVSLQQMAYSDLVCAADSCVPGCRCSLNRCSVSIIVSTILSTISTI